jgi:tRNA A-37 threonylcarbamoyl transferase component Bud32
MMIHMQSEDQVAEWLVLWEEALLANEPAPRLDLLPAELHPRAREGVQLLRGFAREEHGLTTTVPAPHAAAPQVPPDTSRYRFEAFLGGGGMGEVWRGFDTRLAREVALKVLRSRALADEGLRIRFEEEARHIGRLGHPSIVPVYDLGELPDGRPFFAMKLIHGQTLEELLAARATPLEDLERWIAVFEQVCAAVAFAHARDLIHRDLKPSNVMLGEFGEVLVMDWGIAKVLATQRQPAPAPLKPVPSADEMAKSLEGAETLPGQAKGTPAFMAPEQARGEGSRVGKASDVFGLGGILCVILTRRPPYRNTQQALVGDTSEALAHLDGCGADGELIELAKACLAPAPEERPADAAEIVVRVKRYRDAVAARQAHVERELWLRQVAKRAGQDAMPDVPEFSPAAEDARARLRHQAWELLCAEVATQARRLSSSNPAEARDARQVLEALRAFPALAGVQHPALANLAEPERQRWQAFWQDVDERLRQESSS